MKKIMPLLLAGMLVVTTGCTSGTSSSSSEAPGESSASESSSSMESSSESSSSNVEIPQVELKFPSGVRDTDPDFSRKVQEAYEGSGEFVDNPTVTMETSMGSIKIRLFPEQAPKAVENFLTHAKNGYYDGLLFHRVINDFMIQGGDPSGTGTQGESIFGAPFEDEFSDYLHNFRGALSMANAGYGTNSSQFFIVQNSQPLTEETWLGAKGMLLNLYMNLYVYDATLRVDEIIAQSKPDEEIQALIEGLNGALNQKQTEGIPEDFTAKMKAVYDIYAKEGGAPYLDYKHTVFGYVYEGMDIVDKIAAVETESEKPKTDVTITKITVNA